MASIVNAHTIKAAVMEFSRVYSNLQSEADVNAVVDIIVEHALGAAASAVASAWIPGAGSTLAATISAGFVWSMYYRVNKRLGISISKTLLKSLASALVMNVLSAISVGVLGSTLLSFFPGLGSISSSILMGGICYVVLYVCGILYMRVLTRFFEVGTNLDGISSQTLNDMGKRVVETTDLDSLAREARTSYKESQKNGAAKGAHAQIVSDDE